MEEEESTTGNTEAEAALGYPSIRQWELNENSTRWDRLIAAPSDEHLGELWTGYSIAFFLFTTFNTIVFLAVLLNSKTHTKPFNQYLLVQMFPDIVLTGMCAVNCALLAAHGGYYGSWCKAQSFYIFWSVAASSYVHAVIAHEIQRLLVTKMRQQTYAPPTRKRIALFSGACYLWAALVAAWGLVPFAPTQTDSNRGIWCAPMERNTASTVYWWLVWFPISGGIPLLYTTYIAGWIWRNRLLPVSGKRREISIFFFRIYAIFIIMWLPSVIVIFGVAQGVWPSYLSGLWAHATGAVSAGIALLKADIWEAFCDFVTCRTLSNCTCSSRIHRTTSGTHPMNTASTMSPGHNGSNDNERHTTKTGPSRLPSRSGWRTSIPSSTRFAPKLSLTLFPYYIGGYSVAGAFSTGGGLDTTTTNDHPSSVADPLGSGQTLPTAMDSARTEVIHSHVVQQCQNSDVQERNDAIPENPLPFAGDCPQSTLPNHDPLANPPTLPEELDIEEGSDHLG